ncbi:MAG: aminodeoxychorismate synthase component I [Acidiferrobacterales bacterium]
MTHRSPPSPSDFQETGSGYRYLQLKGASDLSRLQQQNPSRYPFLLESPSRGPNGRYDILFSFPGDRLELIAPNELRLNGRKIHGRFFDLLKARVDAEKIITTERDLIHLPFSGGWFVYLGYEMAREIEPTLADLPTDESLPVAMAQRIPMGIVVDRANATTTIIGDPGVSSEQLEQGLRDLQKELPADKSYRNELSHVNEEAPDTYLASVQQAKRYIHDGDIFQANLSRRWLGRFRRPVNPHRLYENLKISNPAPFAGLVLLADQTAIISSSPERLVSASKGIVATRPIAGTYPRGNNARQDKALSEALLRHPKEKAEHIMLIDLERNDLGRVCEPGSVHVNELMVLETYTYVHHIVSEITGRLRPDVGPVDVIMAVFPGGTITGCPKVRCMEIINELEHSPRGAYTGSMGYINRDGSLDLNILIRTLVSHGDTTILRAGAGIVADSVPERELAETRAKAKGMLRAMEAK